MQKNIEIAYEHLSKDKIMSFLIDKFQNKVDWGNRYRSNHALSIAYLIIEQQISFKAAITVKKRFSKLIKEKSSEEIIEMSNNKSIKHTINQLKETKKENKKNKEESLY